MPAFDLINVQIALGGDIRHVVDRTAPENPVTWPEYEILARIHGAGSMRAATNSGTTVSRTQAEERERLLGLYGDEQVAAVYGGTAASLPTKAPDEIPKAEKAKAKPAKAKEPEPEDIEPEPEPAPEDEADEEVEEKHGRVKSKIKELPK